MQLWQRPEIQELLQTLKPKTMVNPEILEYFKAGFSRSEIQQAFNLSQSQLVTYLSIHLKNQAHETKRCNKPIESDSHATQPQIIRFETI